MSVCRRMSLMHQIICIMDPSNLPSLKSLETRFLTWLKIILKMMISLFQIMIVIKVKTKEISWARRRWVPALGPKKQNKIIKRGKYGLTMLILLSKKCCPLKNSLQNIIISITKQKVTELVNKEKTT